MSSVFRNYLILILMCLAFLGVYLYINMAQKFKLSSNYGVIFNKLTFKTNKEKENEIETLYPETDEAQIRGQVNVFIDLGANKGDSVYNFVGLTENAQGGKLNSKNFAKNASWIIYAVEANPFFDTKLLEMKKKVEALGHTVHLYNQTAAWVQDGKIDFYLDTVNPGYDFWGSSLNKNHVPFTSKKNK